MKKRLTYIFLLLMLVWFIYNPIPNYVMAITPPNYVLEVSINDAGDVVFSGYKEKLKKNCFLQHDFYIFNGIHVYQYPIGQEFTYKRVWEVRSSAIYYKPRKPLNYKNIVYLPTKIIYGQPFSLLTGGTKAESLKFNVPYSVSIGISRVTKKFKILNTFTAGTQFVLTKNENGDTEVIQNIKNGIQGLKDIIKKRNLY